ncbi:hypothetical protein PIB30_012323 [Stylosanthes scabra]|uniref:RING-type E3 ubiquitin transferase n=1 Tax=Stylosanthes scabra TaxID=79078 RepID=A0ABU6Y5L5_9FABA|nr:hypothetical protein [Stylosanthes scabra]
MDRATGSAMNLARHGNVRADSIVPPTGLNIVQPNVTITRYLTIRYGMTQFSRIQLIHQHNLGMSFRPPQPNFSYSWTSTGALPLSLNHGALGQLPESSAINIYETSMDNSSLGNRIYSRHQNLHYLQTLSMLMRRSHSMIYDPTTTACVHSHGVDNGLGMLANHDRDVEDMSDDALAEEIANLNNQMKIKPYINLNLEEVTSDDEMEADLYVICQEKFKNEDMLGVLECRHEFYADCLRTWLLEKNFCPLCRLQV